MFNKKFLPYVATAILCFMIGFGVSIFYYPGLTYTKYDLGLVSFCDLTEADRFKVCPYQRKVQELVTGGSVVVYVCKSDFSFGYIETNNLSDISKAKFAEMIERRKHVATFKEECKSKLGTVFSVREKVNQ